MSKRPISTRPLLPTAQTEQMDYFSAGAPHLAPYIDTTATTAASSSSNTSSPDQTTQDRLRMNSLESSFDPSIDAGLFPPGQIWDPINLDAFNAFTTLNDGTQIHSQADSEQGETQPSKARRRAQNRASQRAFRERKERHVKGLETQLELLHEKHQDLLCSYNRQAEGIDKLNSKIAKLASDLQNLKAVNGAVTTTTGKDIAEKGKGLGRSKALVHSPTCEFSKGGQPMQPDTFDAFSFQNPLSGRGQGSLLLYDGYDVGLDGTIIDTLDTTSSISIGGPDTRIQGLPDFEDLLDM